MAATRARWVKTSVTDGASAAAGSVKRMGGVDQPSIDMLTHSGQHDPEKPPIPTGGADLEQAEVVLLALDGTLGTGAALSVEVPKVGIPGDEGVQAVVALGIGVDNAAVG